jgi:hypothetical protein
MRVLPLGGVGRCRPAWTNSAAYFQATVADLSSWPNRRPLSSVTTHMPRRSSRRAVAVGTAARTACLGVSLFSLMSCLLWGGGVA